MKLRFLADDVSEPHIDDGPKNDICPEDDIDVHTIETADYRTYDKGSGYGLDKYQRCTWREAHSQELVMEMGLVRAERMLLAAEAAQYHTNHIQTGHQQDAERYDDGGTDGRRWLYTYIHTVFDDQETHQVSQGQATRIAHEYFPPTVGVTEYVV